MKKNSFYNICVAFLMLMNCTACQQTATYTNIDDDIVLELTDTKETLDIFDEIDSMTLIELDNQIPALIQSPQKMVVTTSNILVFDDYNTQILAFEHNGTFCNTIGTKGHGHGEYTKIYNFNTNESGDTIAVLLHKGVNLYDKSGRFLSKFEFKKNDEFWDDIIMLDGNILLASYHRNTDNLMSLCTNAGEEIATLVSQENNLLPMIPVSHNQLQQDSERICFYDYASSSFYITKKNSGEIKRVKLKSDNILTEELMREEKNLNTEYDHVVSFVYNDGIIRGRLAFRNANGNTLLLNFRIDIDKGIICLKRTYGIGYNFIAVHDGFAYSLVSPSFLLDLKNPKNKRPTTQRLLEQYSKVLNQLPDSVKETDNYYLLKMKLKELH